MTLPAEPQTPAARRGIPQQSSTPACPGCHQTDHIQHVPAAYRAGRSGWIGYDGYGVRQHGVSVTSTAADLDPTEPRHATLGLTVFGIAGILLGGFFALLTRSEADNPNASMPLSTNDVHEMLLIAAIPAVGGLVLLVCAIALARQNRHLERLEFTVWHWWRYAWTCHRCGGVYFPAHADVPSTLYPGYLLNFSGFRRSLWDTARASTRGRP